MVTSTTSSQRADRRVFVQRLLAATGQNLEGLQPAAAGQ